MIRDKNVEWLENRTYIPAVAFATYAGAWIGVDTGTPTPLELGTTGMVTVPVAAGDLLAHLWMVPYDVDRSKQIRFRIWWTQTSVTPTDSIDWTLTYQAVQESDNVAGVVTSNTVMVSPVTALSTPIPLADLSTGVAFQAQATGFGVIDKNTLPATTAFLNLRVAATAIGTFTADEASLMGLEVRYTPRRMSGPEKNLRGGRRLTTSSPLGVSLATTQEG